MSTELNIDMNDPEIQIFADALLKAPQIDGVGLEAHLSAANEGNFDPNAVPAYEVPQANLNIPDGPAFV